MCFRGSALAAFIVFVFFNLQPFAIVAGSVSSDRLQVSIIPEGADATAAFGVLHVDADGLGSTSSYVCVRAGFAH